VGCFVGGSFGDPQFGAGLMGTLFTLAAGTIVDRFSHLPVFIAAGVIPLVAMAGVSILIRAARVA